MEKEKSDRYFIDDIIDRITEFGDGELEFETREIERLCRIAQRALIYENYSKRGPEEREQIIKLRHWSEQKEDYIDAVVCGVNCDCSDLECKF